MSENTNNAKKSFKDLHDRAREFSVQLPFMDGREKGENKELIGQVSTINQFGFIPNEAGEPYAVFTVKEREKRFYFGGMVLTDRLIQLEKEGYREVIETEGLPMLMTEKKGKSNRFYTNVEFFPEG